MVLLAASALAFQGVLFRGIAPHPTGRNGYEEYLAAADIISNPLFNQYMSVVSGLWSPHDPDIPPPADYNPKETELEARRKFVSHFKTSLDLIEQGNQKPVYDPRTDFGPDTTLPELVYFKSLARLEGYAAYIKFADGQTDEGIRQFETALTFSNKICSGPLVFRLVGIACTSIELRQLDSYWPQLSLRDAEQLSKYCEDVLSTPTPLADAFRSEQKVATTSLSAILRDPKKYLATEEDPDAPNQLTKDLGKLSPVDLQATAQDAAGQIYQTYDQVIDLLSGPESNWLQVSRLEKDPDSKSSLATKLASAVLPVIAPSVTAELRQRTKYRLCLLNAKAIEYRWNHAELPTSIEEFTTREERTDPSGGRFLFAKEGNWFRIKRVGGDALGELALSPTPQPAAAGGSDNGVGNPRR